MSCEEHLKEILLPLGVYDLEGPFNGGELYAMGAELDKVEEELEILTRETNLITAESWGLERIAALMVRKPMAEERENMAKALAALLRIGGDSFTLDAINDTISGCGIPAKAFEVDVAAVAVAFPGISGEPEGFDRMKKIIEDILPPHLEIEYWLRYITWAEMENHFSSWQELENAALDWDWLETYVNWENKRSSFRMIKRTS